MISRVKICGLTTPDAVEAAADADYLGFIFFPASPRHVTPTQAKSLAAHSFVPTVAVTVNADNDMLRTILKDFTPAFFQLHGSESPARVSEIKAMFSIPIIKAIGVRNADDLTQAKYYVKAADMLMFDAKTDGILPGGMGQRFDWTILADQTFDIPWFLSGGLTEDTVEEAMRSSGAALVDVSSGVESSPGIKDPARVRSFIDTVHNLSL